MIVEDKCKFPNQVLMMLHSLFAGILLRHSSRGPRWKRKEEQRVSWKKKITRER
jgi:hypothetical protein